MTVLRLFLLFSAAVWLAGSASARSWVVAGERADAGDNNPGTPDRPLKTINAAAQQAEPGDTVLVYSGVYRERVTPARGGVAGQPIIYRVAPGEHAVVKGSERCSDWKTHPGYAGVVTADLAALIPAGVSNPYLIGVSIAPTDRKIVARPAKEAAATLTKTLGQIFFDGAPVTQAATVDTVLATPNTWIVSPDGRQIWAHFTVPAEQLASHLIEVSVRNRIFAPHRRGLAYINVDGFTFEHCANQGPFPQGGAVSPRSGSYWRFAHNTIRFARTAGLDVGSETWDAAALTDTDPQDLKRIEGGHHTVEGNVVSDNGLVGIEGWHHNGVVIRNNIVERNFMGDFVQGGGAEWEEWGGIKLHGQGAIIEGNLIRDNEAFGVWLDNDVSGSRITRNVVLNNRMAGVFVELSQGGVLIDNNIIVGTRSRGEFYDGMGVYTHDACDVTVAHNLILENAGSGVVMRTVSDRTYDVYKDGRLVGSDPVASSRGRVLNNIIWGNSKPAINLPFENPRGTGNVSDYNLLCGQSDYHQGFRPYRQLFAVNIFKSVRPVAEAMDELKAKLAAAAVPASQRPDFETWRWQPFLGLAQWRVFTGKDAHSRELWHGVQVLVRARDLTMKAEIDPSVRGMNCPAVEGVGADFFGHPLVSGHIIPGPVQGLGAEAAEFVIYPVNPSTAATSLPMPSPRQ
ncbi:MAG: right-handed parallel beta-helix repeat-containing protein [Opitutaceae bacterium]|jgi:parallel beta-helix repeat protein